MEQVVPGTTAETNPPQTSRNQANSAADLFSGQSVKDKKPTLPSITQAATHLSPLGPTVIWVEDMGHPDVAPETMAQEGSKIEARRPSSECPQVAPVVAPTQVGPDSACILMTPERPCTNMTAAVPEYRCCGGQARLTAQVGGKEKEISQLLGKPNLPKHREHKLASAKPAKTETQSSGASSPHIETHQPCDGHMKNCLHINQFSRILPTDEFNWARHADVSGFFKYPPADLETMEQAIKEADELSVHHETTLKGLETELDEFLDGHTQYSQAFKRFFDQHNARVKQLRDERHLKAQTLLQLEANIESGFERIQKWPGAENPQAIRDTLRFATTMKAKVDAELKEIDQQLKNKTTLANEILEQNLLVDFNPFKLIEDQRKRADEAEILKERQEWAAWMVTLWRVKHGSTDFRKCAWMWHDVAAENMYPKMMPTYPTGPVTATPRDHAPLRIPSQTQHEIKIPRWFAVLDASGRIGLEGETPEARYQDLVAALQDLENAREIEESEGPAEQKTFQKEWHEANPSWPWPNRQKRGGWWTCRSGPDASEAEQKCSVCHKAAASQVNGVQPRTRPGPPPRRQTGKALKEQAKTDKTDNPRLCAGEGHKKLLAEIEKAMDKCNEQDKMALRARMEQQRQANEEFDRARRGQEQNIKEDNFIRILVAGSPEGKGQEIFCYGGARFHKK
ncbi:hypothetical protein QBC37DRAFT_33206 [Rhypophila decipiens]|uniref:Uncharacterized protein n=1 Tax=Rhypophila decipiens TaxID=261697 RepID=A0AAN6YFS9_9PEZI|nr:hypothetical protein QBC37DRAFT_33206 [Rhypophila decipiens]